jgi:hypothetical protein
MPRVNYQREKRLKDLDRQRKQEEKRAKKLLKPSLEEGTEDTAAAPAEGAVPAEDQPQAE